MPKGSEYELALKIAGKVDASFKNATKSAKGEFSGLASAAKSAFKGIAVAGAAITTAAVAAGKALYDLGAEFDDAYDTIRIGTGATGAALEELEQNMKNVYASVPAEMGDAAQAIADYNTRLGLTGPTLEKLSTQALQVSSMLGDDLGSVIESSSTAFQNWGIQSEDMADKMDFIFKVSQSTGVGFTELMGNLQTYGAQLQAVGYDFEQSAVLLGQVEKAGYDASTIFTALKTAANNASKDGFDNINEGVLSYINQIKNAGSETEAYAIAVKAFGSKAASTMVSAINSGSLSLEDLQTQLEQSGETIGIAAGDTYDFAEKWQMFSNRMKVALEPMAMTLFDALAEAMDDLMPLAEAIFPVIAGAIDSILPALQGLIPIAVEFVGQLAGEILPLLSDIIASVLPSITALMQNLLPVIMQLVSTVLPPIIQIIDQILPPLMQIINAILPTLSSLITALSPMISFIANLIGTVLKSAFTTIGPVIDSVISVFSGLINFISNIFAGNWSAAWDNIVGVFGNIFGGIINIAKIPINGVINAINWVLEKVNSVSIDIPEWVPLLGGSHFGLNIPTIPLLASGGVATAATLAMVGEGAEPEAILPLSKLAEMLGNGGHGGDTYNNNDYNESDSVVFAPVFNFYGPTSPEEAKEAGRISFAEFKRLYQQMKAEERRKKFAKA